jgi:hypothetical protein
MQVVMSMGVKVVSVERRDTPTRYNLFNVRVGYVEMRVMPPQIGWYFILFSLKVEEKKT